MRNMIRREFLGSGGSLLIGFALRDSLFGRTHVDDISRVPRATPRDPNLVDTWLAIHADNTATVFIGFAELGQGASTALLQIAGEELDLDMSQLKSVRLDTSVTPNQGGTYASASIERGGPQIRKAAAEARRALLQLASRRLDASPDSLHVERGLVTVPGRPGASVTYGQLTGDKPILVPFTGSAPLKPAAQYKLVGKSVPRNDIPGKVAGTYVYMQHVRVPGMLHGRVVRPRGQGSYGSGAKALAIDQSSIRHLPTARVWQRGDFIGVVADTEWEAVRAAAELKVHWSGAAPLPGSTALHQKMRAAETTDRVVLDRGNVVDAFTRARHTVSFSCEAPYQSHAVFGPNCAIGDVTPDSALVICSTQDIYATRASVAGVIGLPVEKVRVQYYDGSGTYGRSCYNDVAQAAAILSQLAGKPVRLQFMRWDEHGWDNYGPAHVGQVQAAVDETGQIVAYDYRGWQHNWTMLDPSEELALQKSPGNTPGGGTTQQVSPPNLGAMYRVPNLRLTTHKLPNIGYLRAGWLRSPLDLSFSFASEQAIDELARASGIDPYLFRKQNIQNERWAGVLDAVANAAKWRPRVAASNVSDAKIVSGHGIGLGTHVVSHGAAVAEVEVNRETGSVAVTHLYGAIDAGLVVNPAFVENQISGQLVQTASRMLKEEVTFDEAGVTSLDWSTYPVLRFAECPDVTPIVVQRVEEPSTGAGEEVMAAAAAAIANAFFDATGVRMRQYPFTAERVRAALRG